VHGMEKTVLKILPESTKILTQNHDILHFSWRQN
jgi:hypothetical protein